MAEPSSQLWESILQCTLNFLSSFSVVFSATPLQSSLSLTVEMPVGDAEAPAESKSEPGDVEECVWESVRRKTKEGVGVYVCVEMLAGLSTGQSPGHATDRGESDPRCNGGGVDVRPEMRARCEMWMRYGGAGGGVHDTSIRNCAGRCRHCVVDYEQLALWRLWRCGRSWSDSDSDFDFFFSSSFSLFLVLICVALISFLGFTPSYSHPSRLMQTLGPCWRPAVSCFLVAFVWN